MSNAKLIFITGPSGTGKSTTAKQVAVSYPTPCALLDFDSIREFIKSGYAEPADGWNDETERQWDIAKQVVTAMAHTYISKNVSVVIATFATPHDWPTWKELFRDIPHKAFALLPDVDALLARNNQREGIAKLKESDITQNYEWSVGWNNTADMIVIDNGLADIGTVADQIIEQSK
jgi:predicted kinase